MCTWNSFIWSSSSYTKSDWARYVDLITANENSLFYQLDPLLFLLFLGRETSDHKQVTIFPGNDAINGPVESLVENKWTCNEEEDGWKKAFDETTHARILAGSCKSSSSSHTKMMRPAFFSFPTNRGIIFSRNDWRRRVEVFFFLIIPAHRCAQSCRISNSRKRTSCILVFGWWKMPPPGGEMLSPDVREREKGRARWAVYYVYIGKQQPKSRVYVWFGRYVYETLGWVLIACIVLFLSGLGGLACMYVFAGRER